MSTVPLPLPLPVLRKHADIALEAFFASSGLPPEEVWETLMTANHCPKHEAFFKEAKKEGELLENLMTANHCPEHEAFFKEAEKEGELLENLWNAFCAVRKAEVAALASSRASVRV